MQYSDFPIMHAHSTSGDPLFDKPYKGNLTERERHLLGIAVAAIKGCSECVSTRVKCAVDSGITVPLIQEAVNLIAGYDAGYVISAVIRACKNIEIK